MKGRDARLKIISKNRAGISDAREKLVKLAHGGGDARKKLEKIRNLKAGKVWFDNCNCDTIASTSKVSIVYY